MSATPFQEFDNECRENNLIYTSCNSCVFSIKENELDKACSVNRLKSFTDSGCEVKQLEKDGELFYAVKGRVCNMLRGEEWQTYALKGELIEDSEERIKKLIKIAYRESTITCTCVIYMKEKEGMSADDRLADLRKTLISIKNGEICPKHIVVLNACQIKPSILVPRIREIFSDVGIGCTWNMEYILENDVEYDERYDLADIPGKITNVESSAYLKCIDIAMANIKTQYVTVFEDGDEVAVNHISSINDSINNGLGRFLLAKPDDGSLSGTIVHFMAYKQLKGNKYGTFEEKLQQQCEEQGCENLIKNLSEIQSQ